MPHEIIGEVVGQAVQAAGEVVVQEVHRKTGWKGCLGLTLVLIGIGVGLYFLLR